MFQAYDIESIRNIKIRETAQSLLADALLTPPQYEAVETAFPVNFKQNNIFVSIGLFIFTSLCVLFGCGLFMLFTLDLGRDSSVFFAGSCIFYALVLLVIHEWVIKENRFYRSGADNALLYAQIGFFMGGMALLFKMNVESSAFLFLLFLVLALGTWRYGDPILGLATFIVLLIWLFTACRNTGLGMAMIPLSLAGTSFATYLFSKKQKENDAALYWHDCFEGLEIVSLFTLYGAINYFVIQHFAIELDPRFETDALPLGSVFAVLTALLPIVYIIVGIKKRDRTIWIAGMLCVIGSVMTYRHYHSIMPIEWALTLTGILFLAIGLFLMRYFETPKFGFAYQPEKAKSNLIETLLMNQILQQTQGTGTVQDAPPQYGGGGDFDGGGAGGTF
jgi:hypothetical protein